MRHFYLILVLFICQFLSTANAQVSTQSQRHNFGIGPLAGYDLDIKAPTYGAGLMYEYRPFQKVSFTAGLTYEQTRKNMSDVDYGIAFGDLWSHTVYSLNAGARYYMGDFYLGGALGLGQDKGNIKLQDGNELDGGEAFDLYKSIGAGYQIPLRNGDAVEIEASTFGTSTSMKIGGTVRYKLRR